MRDRLMMAGLILMLSVVLVAFGAATRNQQAKAADAPLVDICPTPLPQPLITPCVIVSVGPTTTATATITATATATETRTKILPRVSDLLPPGLAKPKETVTLPGSTTTIRLPRRTVTAPGKTFTAPPETIRITKPAQTVTRQATVTRGTIVPTPVPTVVTKERHLPGTTITIEKARKVGIGILSALLIIALILGGMWFAWSQGIKTGRIRADEENTGFLRWMRDTIRRPRGKHMMGN